MAITMVLITVQEKDILVISALFIFTFPLCFALWDYELDWSFDIYQYSGLWTAKGLFKNLFFNGFHPVLPWVSFMAMGNWLGKQSLNDTFFVKKIFWSSASAFGVV